MIKIVAICHIMMVVLLLVGCKSTHTSTFKYTAPTNLYLDEQFNAFEAIHIESERDIFLLSNEMKALAGRLSKERDPRKKANKLLTQLFNAENINIGYNSGANVIAAQAFKNREANCLSLTIMAYAIAKEANLNVVFQTVKVPEYWVRNGQANMLTGHINLSVIQPKSSNSTIFLQKSVIEIDFDPFVNKKSFPKQKIGKHTVLAMFYNNKGANAMINGDYITAYAYLKRSTQVDKSFSSAWGNLGILYRLNQQETVAKKSYRHAINLKQSNLTAMENLSVLLHREGKYDEAKRLDSYIMKKRANNPYYYALLGDEKFYQGAYRQAINHYRKAIKLNKNIHEFYFGLAKVYFMLDEIDKAENFIKKAMAKNRVPRIDQQYLAKMNVLKKSRTHD